MIRFYVLLFLVSALFLSSCNSENVNGPTSADWKKLADVPYIDGVFDSAEMNGTATGELVIATDLESDIGENTYLFKYNARNDSWVHLDANKGLTVEGRMSVHNLLRTGSGKLIAIEKHFDPLVVGDGRIHEIVLWDLEESGEARLISDFEMGKHSLHYAAVNDDYDIFPIQTDFSSGPLMLEYYDQSTNSLIEIDCSPLNSNEFPTTYVHNDEFYLGSAHQLFKVNKETKSIELILDAGIGNNDFSSQSLSYTNVAYNSDEALITFTKSGKLLVWEAQKNTPDLYSFTQPEYDFALEFVTTNTGFAAVGKKENSTCPESMFYKVTKSGDSYTFNAIVEDEESCATPGYSVVTNNKIYSIYGGQLINFLGSIDY